MARIAARGSRKKLEEAARVWAHGDASDQSAQAAALSEDLASFGLVIEEAESVRPEPEEGFTIWPDNWDTLVLFGELQTQWRVDGMSGIYLGFDYSGVEALLRIKRVKHAPRVFADLQLMERAALAVLNKK